MELNKYAGAVVVGVDGSDSARRALRWAVDQSRQENRSLVIVHCVTPATALQTGYFRGEGLSSDLMAEVANEDGTVILATAREDALHRAPDLTTSVEMIDGDPSTVFRDLSQQAALVVLGSRGRGPVRTRLLGSVSVDVAKSAGCPVVIERPHHPGTVTRGVLVGIDGTRRSLETLEFAYRHASTRRLPLTVLHADGVSAAVSASLGMLSLTTEQEEKLLVAETLAGLKEKFPDVHVTVGIGHGLPEDSIVAAGAMMDLIVVGHRPWPTAGLHPSTVAERVVERAPCPVAVVPDRSHHQMPSSEL